MNHGNEGFDELPSWPALPAFPAPEERGDRAHPLASVSDTDWGIEFCDLIDPLAASRAVLVEFRNTAPTIRAAAYVQGLIDARTMVAAVAGAAF